MSSSDMKHLYGAAIMEKLKDSGFLHISSLVLYDPANNFMFVPIPKDVASLVQKMTFKEGFKIRLSRTSGNFYFLDF